MTILRAEEVKHAAMTAQLRRLEKAYQVAIEAEKKAEVAVAVELGEEDESDARRKSMKAGEAWKETNRIWANINMKALSNKAGPHEKHIWEAAASWMLSSSTEAADFVVPYTVDCHVSCLAEAGLLLEGPLPENAESLSLEEREMKWRAPRRLAQIRECLHDPIKACLGDGYAKHFGETPFAKIGAPRGTTARLAAWLSKLAELVNEGALPPSLVARTLVFLRGPPLPDKDDTAVAAATDSATSEEASPEAVAAELDTLGSIAVTEEMPGHSGADEPVNQQQREQEVANEEDSCQAADDEPFMAAADSDAAPIFGGESM
mmetsp:Transcript_139417/g.445916  ORF Transcript_139417/g.445916 Transcript_139417/m.445916 type:complete len:319 (+) Transcript_139417:73-1029(+)